MTFAEGTDAAKAVESAIRAALATVVAEHGGMLGDFIFAGDITEVASDGEGLDSGCFMVQADGQKQWRTAGLLIFVQDCQRGLYETAD